MTNRITAMVVRDLRFPTSDLLDGSDAMNPDPDYSAAYVELHTDHPELRGFGMTFTIGRGNELCCAAIEAFREHVVGRDLSAIEADLGGFWRDLAGDSQLRWVGPEKGVVHLATAAVVNAVWDLLSRRAGAPLWRYLADLPAEQLVAAVDFRHLTDALTPDEALDLLRAAEPARADRQERLLANGYPAYITSAGWLGYPDDLLRHKTREAIASGWNDLKIKVGRDLDDDIRRTNILREELGTARRLLIDANQVWDVDEAIAWVRALAGSEPWWIEEPTSPDDILGHARIAASVRPIRVATGEHCHNRVMFKQFFQADAIDIAQIDGCRLGGVNEVIAVLLLAAKFGVPVCPHAGGVGLCQHVQHFSMFDFLRVSARDDDRMIEYAGHLHDHFVEPLRVERGRYHAPTAAGFGLEMKPRSIAAHSYPDGDVWRARRE
ncbi:MAG TPA: enolase C-terminal domain-like protein [Acidimicrobiales bacterium]|jgi:L-fuconate dehydratase|nr:enolase C-terminal domain-like protein [Acidimicrobiales bacterium]